MKRSDMVEILLEAIYDNIDVTLILDFASRYFFTVAFTLKSA